SFRIFLLIFLRAKSEKISARERIYRVVRCGIGRIARLIFLLRKIFRMARTPSTMLPLGTTAPDFRLPDTNGKLVSLSDLTGQPALLVMFICNHCPFVKHVRDELAKLGRDYIPRGVAIVAINS